jgi:AcrR family transcriptional regulator
MTKPSTSGERTEKKKAVRRNIVNAALHLCKDKGYSGVSLREITREAGIAAPSFYNHFTDLEDLGLAIIDEAGLTLRQLLRRARKTVDQDETIIQRSVDTFNRYLDANGEFFHFIVAERIGGIKPFKSAIEREISHIIEDVAESLEEEGRRKNRPIAYPVYVADLIVSCVFNAGATSLHLSSTKRRKYMEKTDIQVKMILFGAESLAARAIQKDLPIPDIEDK